MRKFLTIAAVLIGIALAPAVYAADLHGIVTGKDGKAASVDVVLNDAQNAKVGDPAPTDKTGAYTFTGIKPGNYSLVVNDKVLWKGFVGPGESRHDLTLK
jgi:hypothetical protein